MLTRVKILRKAVKELKVEEITVLSGRVVIVSLLTSMTPVTGQKVNH